MWNRNRRFGVCCSGWLIAGAQFLTACSEEAPKAEGQKTHTVQVAPPETWLDVRSHEDPAAWLISRQSRGVQPSTASNLREVREALMRAAKRFEESPRIIANRAAQLQDMLEDMGEHTTAIGLIGDLTAVLGDQSVSPGFGNIGAYYVNLRQAGSSREEALEELSKRYNPAS